MTLQRIGLTSLNMNSDDSPSRRAGDEIIVAQAQRQVQTFFDELKNGTRNYRTVASLDAQIAQEYRGRCILELLQNAHDALAHADPDEARRISFVLSTDSEPVLSVGNSGRPFREEDFDGICQLAQSAKDPNESVGNKGLGFRSVLEVSSRPEIWVHGSHRNRHFLRLPFQPGHRRAGGDVRPTDQAPWDSRTVTVRSRSTACRLDALSS